MTTGQAIQQKVKQILESLVPGTLQDVIVQPYSLDPFNSQNDMRKFPVAILRPPTVRANAPYESNVENLRIYEFAIHVVAKAEEVRRDPDLLVGIADAIADAFDEEVDLDGTANAGLEAVASTVPVDFVANNNAYVVFEVSFVAKALVEVRELTT